MFATRFVRAQNPQNGVGAVCNRTRSGRSRLWDCIPPLRALKDALGCTLGKLGDPPVVPQTGKRVGFVGVSLDHSVVQFQAKTGSLIQGEVALLETVPAAHQVITIVYIVFA